MPRAILSRRTVLRGATGGGLATIALPRLEAMLNGNGTAHADGSALPVRFGVWLWHGGITRKHWIPETTGPSWELKEQTQPFAKVKPDITLFTGMDVQDINNGLGHYPGLSAMLSGAPQKYVRQNPDDPMISDYTMARATIDIEVANAIGAATKFEKGLQLGVLKPGGDGTGFIGGYSSFNGPLSVNPPECSPAALFARLFGDGAPAGPAISEPAYRKRARTSVLDFVLADAGRLKARLGVADRARIDEHADRIRALEKRINAIAPAATPACTLPPPPTDPAPEVLDARSRLMSDLLVMALKCDLARVFSMQFSATGVSFRGVGIDTDDLHSDTHNHGQEYPPVRQAIVFMMQRLAYFLEQLQAADEGGRPLIDRCAILASTDNTEGADHSATDYPIIVAGRAGGRLKTGVHHRGNHDNTSKVHLTILRALGIPAAEYGLAERRATESIAALEA